MSDVKRVLRCSLCPFTTKTAFSLKNHQNVHADRRNLKCSQCSFTTSWAGSLARHEKSHANDQMMFRPILKDYNCLMCEYSAPSRKDILHHFVVEHGIVLTKQNLSFQNFEDFSAWKEEFERSSAARFVRSSAPSSTPNGSKTYYTFRCHRDGFFVPRGSGKRHLKQLGSNKINGCCPAGIKATVDNVSSQVKVEVLETHVGHSNDIVRLSLTMKEKESLASRMAAKEEMNEILDDLREELISGDVDRVKLITKKDLRNISCQFNLKSKATKGENDCTSVDSWVEENSDSAAVSYEPQEVVLDSHPQLAEKVISEKPSNVVKPEKRQQSRDTAKKTQSHENLPKDAIADRFSKNESTLPSFEEEKKKVEREMHKILNYAHNSHGLKIIMDHLASIIPAIKAFNEANTHPKGKIGAIKKNVTSKVSLRLKKQGKKQRSINASR